MDKMINDLLWAQTSKTKIFGHSTWLRKKKKKGGGGGGGEMVVSVVTNFAKIGSEMKWLALAPPSQD